MDDRPEQGRSPAAARCNASGPAISRRCLVWAAACVAVVYLAGVTGRWWPTPDSAVYLGLGRSIAAGEGYRFNGQVDTTFPPGLPILLAGIRWAFGAGFWAPNLFIAVCGLTAGLVIYLSIRLLADPLTAFLVALGTVLSYQFYFDSHRILSDIPFALAFWASLYAAVRYLRGSGWWLVAAALLAAVGTSVRLPGVLLFGPLAVGMVLEGPRRSADGAPASNVPSPACAPGRARRRGLAARALGGGAVLAAAALTAAGFYTLARHVSPATPKYVGLAGRGLQDGQVRYLRYLGRGLERLPLALAEVLTSQEALWPFALAVLLLIVVGTAVLWRRRERLTAPLVILYPMALALGLGVHGMRPRYLTVITPVLLYASLTGLRRVAAILAARMGRRASPGVCGWTVAAFTALIVLSNLPRLGRNAFYYSVLSHRPGYYERIRSGRYANLFSAAEVLRRHCPPRAVVGTVIRKYGVLHFLSERRIRYLPTVRRGAASDATPEFLAADQDLDFVLLEAPRGEGPSPANLSAVLESDPRWRLIDRGWFLLYKRTEAK